MQGFELSAHLIGAHDFFGGPDTEFRLEPEAVVQQLQLG